MIIESKAPLRISFAGGGTDVSPYSNQFGGLVCNATINLYATATLKVLNEPKFMIWDELHGEFQTFSTEQPIRPTAGTNLAIGVLLYFRPLLPEILGLQITTEVGVPMGCGLGTSSTLTVALVAAFAALTGSTFSAMKTATVAYQIEREQLLLAGGKQDQFAAAFGGFNTMTFGPRSAVKIQPLNLPNPDIRDFRNHLVLVYSGQSRVSSQIIEEQQQHVIQNDAEPLQAMHLIKQQAEHMQQLLKTGNWQEVGKLLDAGFQQKKKMARQISNPNIDQMYQAAIHAGAWGGKISGAGGGGFLFFCCPPDRQPELIKTLNTFDAITYPFEFSETGVTVKIRNHEQPNITNC